MAGRISSVFGAFCRGWLFGVVLGFVVGGSLGTAFIPVVGTAYGALVGVVMGAAAGLGAALLIAPAAVLRASVVADRIWPGVVSAAMAFVLVTKVLFSGSGVWEGGDGVYVLAVVAVAGGVAMLFGPAVTRRVRTPYMSSVLTAVYGSIVGAVVSGWRVVSMEGLSEPGLLAGLTFGGWVAGGILGAVLVIYNLLVTKEPAAE